MSTRYEELRDEIAKRNKGKHYLLHDHETFHVEALCAEIDRLRDLLHGVRDETDKRNIPGIIDYGLKQIAEAARKGTTT